MPYRWNPLPPKFDRVETASSIGAILEIDGDTGTAIPVAGVVNIVGGTSSTANTNGIFTTGAGDTLTVSLSNRLQATGSTVGAVTADIITFALGATPAVFTFDFSIKGFSSATSEGCGYTLVGSVKTDGASATLLPNQALDNFEEGACVACTAAIVVSGNNAIIRVNGAAGLTIQWAATGTYV